MAQALINPAMLTWARQRAALSIPALAGKLGVKEDRLASWETGELKPTFKQAQNFAKIAHVSFGYLFLNRPPEEKQLLPDLRTINSEETTSYSLELKETINDCLARQQWYAEYLREQEEDGCSVIGRATAHAMDTDEIVADMREKLDVTPYPQRGNWEEYLRDLIAKIENIGILVMRNSMAGKNTRRPLSVSEFRGFAIVNELAPVIFINTADCPEARLFTLIHELAHIWIGKSGVSNAEPDNHSSKEEQLCNAVAAEFLVPADEFNDQWQTLENWRDNLPVLAGHFRVSQWVIARRALTLNYIETHDYRAFVAHRLAEYRTRPRDEDNSPNFNRLQVTRISKRFAKAVASEALSGRVLLRDAYRLTGIKPHNLAEFSHKELGI